MLLIADIGGYTHYMTWNRMHLVHAQQTVAELLEAVIDAGKGLKLAKLEGDAAFFWAPGGNPKVVVCERITTMRQAFLARRERLKKDIACDCKSCSQLGNLSLKFVTHEGDVAEQKVKRRVELAGFDVILVHRMLKNLVPVPEYVLMTDVVAACLDESMRKLSIALTHDFEASAKRRLTISISPRPRCGPWCWNAASSAGFRPSWDSGRRRCPSCWGQKSPARSSTTLIAARKSCPPEPGGR
ncbi:hypothetical protein BZL30_1292 [Mycobacterium kansasii]|uniref:DUF2652 domain-containing protein n=1 Tax=Mycobacterium kansasii TaxID=1768 RepID=A0A1V3XUX8_MYCKA|nr:hypothetical protein BZL30_1292 [Mycobacterium kansasii]